MEKRKNIHLLPTNKPSRFQKTKHDNFFLASKIELYTDCIAQHIYITSDEEIKDGYFLDLTHNIVMKSVFYPSSDKNCKKIILTTNQDLIKDGVQAIGGIFLEWFVQNSSCEMVEVKLENYYASGALQPNLWQYKIIIPKEEPKRTHYLDELPNIDKDTLVKMWEATIPRVEPKREVFLMNAHGVLDTREPKQETLEEVAERLHPEEWDWREREIFIDGAKWMQERMYSEEEVKRLAFDFYYDMSRKMGVDENLISENATNVDLWFKQNKKKQQ